MFDGVLNTPLTVAILNIFGNQIEMNVVETTFKGQLTTFKGQPLL